MLPRRPLRHPAPARLRWTPARTSPGGRWLVLGLLSLCLQVGLGGCRTGRLIAADPEPVPQGVTPPLRDETVVCVRSEVPVAGHAVAIVEPGVYRADARFQTFATGWPTTVAEAVTLLGHRTGLDFAEGPPVRVVLAPLRDERIAHRVSTRIVAGRRQAVVTVNAEPLVAGRARPDIATVRALAASIFELASLRHDPVPAWVAALAGAAAAGDTEVQLRRLSRDAALEVPRTGRVDATDVLAADATGLAVLLLLEDRQAGVAIRRLLDFARQGDDPDWMLRRLLHEADAAWVGPARNALEEHLGALDARAWVRLREAELAYRTTGRGGLVAILSPPREAEIEGEARVLLAQAAVEAGDWAAAREIYLGLSRTHLASLRNPSAALALEIEIESRPDGNPARAQDLMHRFALDYPQSDGLARLRDRFPLLGSGEAPLTWLERKRRRIAERGPEGLDLATLERVLRILLLDHRAGAAARLVDRLEGRAEAPELEPVVALVNEAERAPTPAAIAANERRLASWLAAPDKAPFDSVSDGGRAAFGPALAAIGACRGAKRGQLIRLLEALVGPVETLQALAPRWQRAPHRAGPDLEALAAVMDARVLSRSLRLLPKVMLSSAARERLWHDVSDGLAQAWLDVHPSFLRDLRSPTFMERRKAFRLAERRGVLTPELVGRVARDVAPGLRAMAMGAAGRAGFAALAASGIEDASPRVRAAAVGALAAADPEQAAPILLRRLRRDPVDAVRIAAARALADAKPRDAVFLDALVATQGDAPPDVQDAVAAQLLELPAVPVVRALVRASRVELDRRRPRMPVFARTVLLFQRLSGEDLQYVPGLDRRALTRILQRMQRWADRASAKLPGAGPEDRRLR